MTGTIHIFEVDRETCVGCNLCSLVCPVDGCISMIEVDSGLPSMTWEQYQNRLGRGEIEPISSPEHRNRE